MVTNNTNNVSSKYIHIYIYIYIYIYIFVRTIFFARADFFIAMQKNFIKVSQSAVYIYEKIVFIKVSQRFSYVCEKIFFNKSVLKSSPYL